MNNYNFNCLRKNGILIIVFFASYFKPVAQTTISIVKCYAYYTISQLNNSPKGGGKAEVTPIQTDSTIAVNEPVTLQKLDTQIIIYVETTTQLINWKTATQGIHDLQIAVQQVPAPFYPGLINGKGQVLINVKKGNYLYALRLGKKSDGYKKNVPLKKTPVVLKAVNKIKTFTFKTPKLIELFQLPPA